MAKIAGTGHRPDKLGGYGDAVTDRLVNLAIDALVEQKPSLVISGMALGWDMALAEAAYCLYIPFHAYIPFVGQESKWPAPSQKLYRTLMEKADQVVECAPPGYAVWKMQQRNVCMVDEADLILALWDGSSGGTGNCIEYAQRFKKPIINLWDRYHG